MRNDSEGLGVSLMRLFTEIACFDVDRQRSFEKLRKEFGDLDQSRCKTFSMAIATEMLSYDMCEGSYGGPFCTAYDRYLNMYRALEQHTLGVADAIADIIVETDDIDTLSMKWEEAKGLILRGFKRAAKYRQNDVNKKSRPEANPAAGSVQLSQMSAHPIALGAAKDIEIKCNCKEFTADGSTCGDMFCHTVAKQEDFAVKKLTTPVRCPSYRKKRREKEGKSKPCPQWMEHGRCPFGDECVHSHYDTNKSQAAHSANMGGQKALREGPHVDETDSDDSNAPGW
jgi:hypothetical protein